MLDGSTPREGCPCCGERRFEYLEGGKAARLTYLCGRNTVQVSPSGEGFDYVSARERIAAAMKLTAENDYLLRAEFGERSLTLYRDGRALIHGTSEEAEAKTLYAKWVGS